MAKQPDEIDELLDKLIKGKSPEEILGKNGLIRQPTKRAAEHALQGEMTEHLGYEKNAPEGRKSGNSRNGSSRKRVIADSGELDLEIPRNRNGDFELQLIRKSQRRLPGFDEKVIAHYARGTTTREIQGHLHEVYGNEVSPSLISAITDSVLEDVRASANRSLHPLYPIVYLDAIHKNCARRAPFRTTQSTWPSGSIRTARKNCSGFGLAKRRKRSSG